jgi:hypothetical protein
LLIRFANESAELSNTLFVDGMDHLGGIVARLVF